MHYSVLKIICSDSGMKFALRWITVITYIDQSCVGCESPHKATLDATSPVVLAHPCGPMSHSVWPRGGGSTPDPALGPPFGCGGPPWRHMVKRGGQTRRGGQTHRAPRTIYKYACVFIGSLD